jgi:hypothetical protein
MERNPEATNALPISRSSFIVMTQIGFNMPAAVD